MGKWKRQINKYQLFEMLKLSDSYLLTPKLGKLWTDENWAWIPQHVSIWLIINLLWECHAPCSASPPSKCLLPWAALFTCANVFGLSWPAHPQLCLAGAASPSPGWPSRSCEHNQGTHWPCSSRGSPLKILTAAFDLNFFRAFKNELRFNTCFCPFLKCSHHELLN